MKTQENTQNPKQTQQKTRELVLATASGGMAIALGTLLSIFTVIRMPQGGSLTIGSMLPIIFCALAFGPVWGFGIAIVYGALQFIIAPYAAHWASIFLDYPIAFRLLGLAGLFAAPAQQRRSERHVLRRISLMPLYRIPLAVTVAMLGRLLAHVLSGVIFFASYTPEGQNVWLYSLGYNATYMIPEILITCVLLLPLVYLFKPRQMKGKGRT